MLTRQSNGFQNLHTKKRRSRDHSKHVGVDKENLRQKFSYSVVLYWIQKKRRKKSPKRVLYMINELAWQMHWWKRDEPMSPFSYSHREEIWLAIWMFSGLISAACACKCEMKMKWRPTKSTMLFHILRTCNDFCCCCCWSLIFAKYTTIVKKKIVIREISIKSDRLTYVRLPLPVTYKPFILVRLHGECECLCIHNYVWFVCIHITWRRPAVAYHFGTSDFTHGDTVFFTLLSFNLIPLTTCSI